MNFTDVIVRMDTTNRMWVDIKVRDIQVIHRASLMGGRFCIYELYGQHYMNFVHQAERAFFNFYGLQITEEQYLFQMQSWGNDSYEVKPGTELILADNLYFI